MKESENENNAEAGSVESSDLFGIDGCHDCPFYEQKYCGLAQWLNHRGHSFHAFVVNEWRTEKMPEGCPLKTITPTFFPNAKRRNPERKEEESRNNHRRRIKTLTERSREEEEALIRERTPIVKSILARGKTAVFTRPHQLFRDMTVVKKVHQWEVESEVPGQFDLEATFADTGAPTAVALWDHNYVITEE